MLRHLSAEMGDEWKKMAQILNIRRVRIEAILRNNVNSSTEQAVYDMLTTWAKRVPRSLNKVHDGYLEVVEGLNLCFMLLLPVTWTSYNNT